jgi:hypothetical protein
MSKLSGSTKAADLRSRLVGIALEWQDYFGVAPAITGVISELDAALLVGMTDEEYGSDCAPRTAVTKGYDFKFRDSRYQVKANRPSGKPGSPVTLVAKAHNYDWDKLIWILYDRKYELQEAWEWNVDDYRKAFESRARLRPEDMRGGHRLFPGPKSKMTKSDEIMARYRNTLRALAK